MRIDEIANQPLEWKWYRNTPGSMRQRYKQIMGTPNLKKTGAEFEAGDQTIFVVFAQDDDGIYHLLFDSTENRNPDKAFKLTGAGTATAGQIFATIAQITSEFIDKMNLDHIAFVAASEKRAKLYLHLAKRFAPGWKTDRTFWHGHIRFDLVR